MAISFLECQTGQLGMLQSFFDRVYPPAYALRTTGDLFRWQFGGTAGNHRAVYTLKLALMNGEVVGCLGYIPIEVSVLGRVVPGAWLVNWMTDPAVRRFGLGVLLVGEVAKEFEVVLNVGPNQSAADMLLRTGWQDVGDLARYIYVLDWEQAARLTENCELEGPTGVRATKHKPPLHSAVGRLDRFSDEATDLWDRVWGGVAAGVRRSAEFLNWRYADHPLFEYRAFAIRQREMLRGIAVYRIERVTDLSTNVGRLVELISEPGFDACLLDAVVEDARAHQVVLLDFFCSSRRVSRLMIQSGFSLTSGDLFPVLFQPVDRAKRRIAFVARLGGGHHTTDLDWYVTKGDGDQDRPN